MSRKACFSLLLCASLWAAPVIGGGFTSTFAPSHLGQGVAEEVESAPNPPVIPVVEPATPAVGVATASDEECPYESTESGRLTQDAQAGKSEYYGDHPGQSDDDAASGKNWDDQSSGSGHKGSGHCTSGQSGSSQYGAGQSGNGYAQPTTSYAAADAFLHLLALVRSDVHMCLASIQPYRFLKNTFAIGHLNDAQSALRRASLQATFHPLMAELDQRISRVKFHIVMNDVRGASMMLAQLAGVVDAMIRSHAGTGANNNFSGNGHTYYYPDAPVVVPVMPSMPTSGYDWGQGQNLPPRNVPINLVPVSD